jgi:subtilisin family serine protease
MATKRVIAYYMHEDERAAAAALMPGADETESFMIGEIEDAGIEALRRRGLVVEAVPEVSEPRTSGREALLRTPGTGRVRRFETPAPRPDRPTYFLLQLSGPLLDTWRSRISAAGAELLEYVPQNAYVARLEPSRTGALQALPFVQGIRLYEADDTGPGAVAAARSPTPGVGARMLTFDVRLHRAEEMGEVRSWLDERRVPLAGTSGRKLRIYALEGSAVVDELAALPQVATVEPYSPPKLHNDVARGLLGIDASGAGPGGSIELTGDGEIVAVADTGLDERHPDFANRIVGVVALGRPNDASDPHGHGTHVAGSVLGDGSASNGAVKGAAPGARLFFQSLLDANGGLGGLPLSLEDLFEEAYQAGARIHNDSWGAATQSRYTMDASEVDDFVARRRDMLVVVSAGNEGTSAACVHAQRGFVDWLSIGSPASCKNALVVGASRSSRTAGGYSQFTYGSAWPQDFPDPPIGQQPVSGDDQAMAAFSSRGPCDDRRIKPDLVAPGTDIASAKSSRAPLRNFWGPYPNNPCYAFMGGTSMSAPLVSGCAALVRQYYVQQRSHGPSAALLKATLINGTRWLSGPDSTADHPTHANFHQGFGRVYLPTTVPTRHDPDFRLEFLDTWQTPARQFGQTGQRFRFQVDVDDGDALRICLAWTDPPGRGTQNSLGLFVEDAATHRKWLGNENLLGALTKPDPDNNVQAVRIPNAPRGTYNVMIAANNLLHAGQDFALVVGGRLASGLRPL